MITYAKEKWVDIVDDCIPLFQRHWEEIALNKDKVKLAINFEAYQKLCDADILKAYTARDGEKIVGYHIFLVTPHLHYMNDLFAVADVLFVAPEYRGKMAGLKLIKFSEQQLKADGVAVIVQNTKLAHDFGPILERLGYSQSERIFTKYTGD